MIELAPCLPTPLSHKNSFYKRPWAFIQVGAYSGRFFLSQTLAHKRPWALIWVGAYSNEYGIFINSKKYLYICIYHPTIFIEFIHVLLLLVKIDFFVDVLVAFFLHKLFIFKCRHLLSIEIYRNKFSSDKTH